MNVVDVAPSLEHLRRLRLLKESASGTALVHSIAQDFWREDMSAARKIALRDAWYMAFAAGGPLELTVGDAVAMLQVIAPKLLQERSRHDISVIGTRLIQAGQIDTGLQFLDSNWSVGQLKERENTVHDALIAAQTRLQLGRYSDVDEPLTFAEHEAQAPQERLAVLLVRMKLALRRNAYDVLWRTYGEVESLASDDLNTQVEAQSILNVAYRDLLDPVGIKKTSVRLEAFRERLDEKARLSVDRVLARALTKLGDLKPALEYAESALKLADEFGSARDLGNAYLARAEVNRYTKNYTASVTDYGRAAGIARGIANRDSLLWSLLGEAATHLESGHQSEASPQFDELHSLLKQPGYEHPLESAHLALLEVLAGLGTQPGSQVVEQYKRLGVEWPAALLIKFAASGRIDGPTPL
jgi:tetratricopeptide (TPR) repeat protein